MVNTQTEKVNNNNVALSKERAFKNEQKPRIAADVSKEKKEAQVFKTQDDKKNLNEKLLDASKQLNNQMQSLGTNLRFSFNDEVEQMYIKVTEKDTGKLVRQIPSEEALELIKHFRDAIGLIFDKES